jgi:hypothetical protein
MFSQREEIKLIATPHEADIEKKWYTKILKTQVVEIVIFS